MWSSPPPPPSGNNSNAWGAPPPPPGGSIAPGAPPGPPGPPGPPPPSANTNMWGASPTQPPQWGSHPSQPPHTGPPPPSGSQWGTGATGPPPGPAGVAPGYANTPGGPPPPSGPPPGPPILQNTAAPSKPLQPKQGHAFVQGPPTTVSTRQDVAVAAAATPTSQGGHKTLEPCSPPWEIRSDPATGKPFYFNTETRATSLIHPSKIVQPKTKSLSHTTSFGASLMKKTNALTGLDFLAQDQGSSAQVPPGMVLKFTSTGVPYLVKAKHGPVRADTDDDDDEDSEDDEDAMNEHVQKDYDWNMSLSEILEVYGRGIYFYFDFVKFLIAVNLVLTVLSLLNFIPHAIDDAPNCDSSSECRDTGIWFFGSYFLGPNWNVTWVMWLFSISAASLVWFLLPKFYTTRVQHFFIKSHDQDFEDNYAGQDSIHKNRHVTPHKRRVRIFLSTIVFFVCLGISGVASYGLNLIEQKAGGSFLIAAFITGVNIFWKKLCVALTEYEAHSTWTEYRKNVTLKTFSFKLLNIIVLYAIKSVVLSSSATNEAECKGSNVCCKMNDVGLQFFFILLVDLTISNAMEIGIPFFTGKFAAARAGSTTGSNEASKPEFDLSEEYLELLYRQFIIYLGMASFPLITLLGFVGNILEYFMDRYRLIKICKMPPKMSGSMKRFISFFLFVIAIAAFAAPPYGVTSMYGNTAGVLDYCGPQYARN